VDFFKFLCAIFLSRLLSRSLMVLLAVRMVADVTETRNVFPSLEFKT